MADNEIVLRPRTVIVTATAAIVALAGTVKLVDHLRHRDTAPPAATASAPPAARGLAPAAPARSAALESQTPATAASPQPRTITIDDPAGDVNPGVLPGTPPAYADLRSTTLTVAGDEVRVTFVMGGDLPSSLPADGTSHNAYGITFTQGATWAYVSARLEQNNWRLRANDGDHGVPLIGTVSVQGPAVTYLLPLLLPTGLDLHQSTTVHPETTGGLRDASTDPTATVFTGHSQEATW